MLLDPAMANGNVIPLARTNERHFDALGKLGPVDEPQKQDFQSLMMQALEGTNKNINKADNLIQAYNLDPSKVNIEDVMNAMAEAQMTLSLARNVIERGINAYRDITNMR